MFGLFESSTVTTVGTSVSRAIQDRLLPNAIKAGTIQGILSPDNQLTEHILEEMISSIGVTAERMYDYSKAHYIWGAPSSVLHRSTDSSLPVLNLLTAQENLPVTLDYCSYGPMNRLHFAWQHIFDTYGYKPQTNELPGLSALKGSSVYLEDLQVVIPEASVSTQTPAALVQWGPSATNGYTPIRMAALPGVPRQATPYRIATDPLITADSILLTYVWGTPSNLQRELVSIPFVVVDPSYEYIQVRYTSTYQAPSTGHWVDTAIGDNPSNMVWVVDSTPAPVFTTKFFTYRIGSGVWSALDELFTSTQSTMGTFFPYAHFRAHKKSLVTDTTTEEYKSTKKLLKYIGMDFMKVATAIDDNPDIKDVDAAFLMLAVPADSTNPIELMYLFDFFKELHLNLWTAPQPGDITGSLMSYELAQLDKLIPAAEYTDPVPFAKHSLVIKDGRTTSSLGVSGIYRKTFSGSIGKVGTHGLRKFDHVMEHQGVRELSDGGSLVSYTWTTSIPVFCYQKQLTSTLYEEIQVYDARRTYQVDGSHTTTNIMIPLDYSITQQYTIKDKEELYARSLHYVMHAIHQEKLSWYQQEWFADVIMIVAIAWTVFTMGSDGGSVLAAAIAAGTATFEMIVAAVIVAALEYLIISLIAKIFVKVLGVEFALVFAIVMAAYGLYIQTTTGVAGAPWAKDLLSLSSSTISSVSESYTKSLQGLKEESDEFNLLAKTKMDELEKVREEIEGGILVTPFVLFGEDPDAYFSRTVHTGNIGTTGISAISNYCAIALTLPTFGQTFRFE